MEEMSVALRSALLKLLDDLGREMMKRRFYVRTKDKDTGSTATFSNELLHLRLYGRYLERQVRSGSKSRELRRLGRASIALKPAFEAAE
jgi:hypothetical protein